MTINYSNTIWLLPAIVLIFADQFTKSFAINYLELGSPMMIFSWLRLTLAFNTGAAFSLLHQAGGWQILFFVTTAILVSAYLFYWLLLLKHDSAWLTKSGIALLLSGSLGNLIDRVYYGYVVDFVQLYHHSVSFPIFNLADCCITLGALLMCIDYLINKQAVLGSKLHTQ